MSSPPTEPPAARLAFHGGLAGGLAPFALFLTGAITLGLAGTPDERGFLPVLMAALALGMLLARDRNAYADSVVAGMSRPIVAIMAMAWLLAGMLARLVQASGLVDALVALADAAGLSGGGYVAAAFVIACGVSTATGTSLGTILLCAPLLYPAGAPLAASPAWLAGALLAGATFGDNISPVSDTTIASATSQGAPMGAVVKSRLRYALPAAAVAIVVYATVGGHGTATDVPAQALEPTALLMLGAPALVVAMLLGGHNLLSGLFSGVAAAVGLGLIGGRFAASDLLTLDRESFLARGLLLEGIERGIGIAVFTLLLMGLTGALEATGVLDRLVARAQAGSRGPRGAELWIVGAVSGAVLLTTHAVVAILAVGAFSRATGRAHGIPATRRANLLDLAVSTYPFLLPWFIPTILLAGTTRDAGDMPVLGAWTVGLHNVHSWCLLLVLAFAIATGWGRGNTAREPSDDESGFG